jgi:hypothetical protein
LSSSSWICPVIRQEGNGVVHPVQTTQEGGFAAAGRADEGDDFVGADVEADMP